MWTELQNASHAINVHANVTYILHTCMIQKTVASKVRKHTFTEQQKNSAASIFKKLYVSSTVMNGKITTV